MKSPQCKETSDVIMLIDQWFDIMNSCMRYDFVKTGRYAFSGNQHQIEILDKMIDFASDLRIKGKVYPFQRGIIISSKSIKGLYVVVCCIRILALNT